MIWMMSKIVVLIAQLTKFLLVSTATMLMFSPLNGIAASKVIFTIDVESNNQFPLPEQVDAVCQNNIPCGLMEISKRLSEKNYSGTFFLNVYEYSNWGKKKMHSIANSLQNEGHDIALHTHPQWVYDPNRWAMFQYSLEEQIAIIRDGKKLLREWTGLPVLAHRAGAYSADERTIVALESNGIRLDSSLFLQSPNCRLNGIGMPVNVPSLRQDVIQIPVTVYIREVQAGIFSELLTPIVAIRKIDPDWFVNESEVKDAIDTIIKSEIPFVVVFLHSYSFMDPPKKGQAAPSADSHSMKLFNVIIDHIQLKGLEVVTMRELIAEDQINIPLSKKDIVPHVKVSIGLPRYIWHYWKAVGIFKVLTIAASSAMIIALLSFVLIRHNKKKSE